MPDLRTWHQHLQDATQALLHRCLDEGCVCRPEVVSLPSTTNDANVELVLAHEPGCPARPPD